MPARVASKDAAAVAAAEERGVTAGEGSADGGEATAGAGAVLAGLPELLEEGAAGREEGAGLAEGVSLGELSLPLLLLPLPLPSLALPSVPLPSLLPLLLVGLGDTEDEGEAAADWEAVADAHEAVLLAVGVEERMGAEPGLAELLGEG